MIPLKTSLKTLLLCGAAALLLNPTAPALAQAQPAEPELDAKQIRIDTQSKALQLEVTGVKASYAIDEPIELDVRGNHAFYLWVYARDPSGDAVLLVPSSLQTANKYQGGRTHRVPNPGLRFAADEAGPHEITLIASTRWLDIDLARRAGTGSRDNLPFKAAELDHAFTEKGIRIQRDGARPASRSDAVVRQIAFTVRGEPARPDPAAAGPLTFVKMDRADYRIGDSFRLVFGATEDGFVHVFLREPNGDVVRVLDRPVAANRLYHETGAITAPAGRQRMMAVYTKDGRASPAFAAKGVTLDCAAPEIPDFFDFVVRR